ncbi:unnamed protein product [Malus baccata var. baccata]
MKEYSSEILEICFGDSWNMLRRILAGLTAINFDLHGKFETAKLSPATLYEVVFVVKLNAANYGWGVPVNFRLTLPHGTKQWRKVK